MTRCNPSSVAEPETSSRLQIGGLMPFNVTLICKVLGVTAIAEGYVGITSTREWSQN